MPQIALDPALLPSLLEDWRLRLRAWAQSGALSRAAMEALRLPEEPETLKQLVGRWGAGDWGDLPPVEVLPASAMPSAAGAYAISTGTIYLNQAWLQGASREAALAVLTEELGHHLDGLLNASDTPGDEGELFVALVCGKPLSDQVSTEVELEDDTIQLRFGDLKIFAESSVSRKSVSITQAVTNEHSGRGLTFTFDRFGGWPSDDYGTTEAVLYVIRGSATYGVDYLSSGGLLSNHPEFGSYFPNELVGMVTFDEYSVPSVIFFPVDDQEIEPDEEITLSILNQAVNLNPIGLPVYWGYGDSSATGTIFDDDQIVSLSVTPAAVAEDGNSNLVYTFSRSANGALNRSLAVNYTVAGTATLGNDYTGIAESPAIKTVTFAPGSSTAVVIVDPTVDTAIELDETVALALATGAGYTVGTPTAVTGTITNDDFSFITLSVSPISVTEDGISSLTYIFSRTGSASNPLTINYAVAGSATPTRDYTGLSAMGSTQSITFPAGAFTTSVTLDPIADTEIEMDETIIFTLVPGNGYTLGTTGAVMGTILNDDTTIESAGNTKLIRDGDGSGFAQVGNSQPIKITSPWGANIGSNTTVWQILAAETIAGVNQLLWRNNIGNFLHTWKLDANWSWTASFGMIAPSSSAGWDLEAIFLVDANGDSIIGNPFDTIETKGNTSLLRHANGQAFAQAGNTAPIAITSPWGASIGSPSTPWQIIAVDTIAGVNQLLWRNNSANFLHTWTLDQNWSWTASSGMFDPNAPAGWSLESSFQIDANGDGIIGSPHSTIESQGNTSLLRHANGQAYAQVGSTAPIAIISPWGTPVGSPNSAWQMLAAETIAGVNQVLLRNNSGNFLHTWTLNSNWNWASSGGTFALNDTPGWSLESSFQVDANNDGIIGSPFSTIESRGGTTLLRRGSDDQAFIQVGTGPRTPVTTPWGAPVGGTTSTWQVLAAETIGGVNQVLLRNNPGNFLHTWTLNSNWTWTASNGTISPTSAQGLALLNQFGLG